MISMQGLILILVIVLIVFGPGKLPEVGRALGRGIQEFKKASENAAEPISKEPPAPPVLESAKVIEATSANADAPDKQPTETK